MYRLWLYLILIGASVTGCLQIVEPESVAFSPQLVVESYPEVNKPVRLHLTYSQFLWSGQSHRQTPEEAPPVLGAYAELTVNNRKSYEFVEDSMGYYHVPPSLYLPVIGDTMSLSVKNDGVVVNAQTEIPQSSHPRFSITEGEIEIKHISFGVPGDTLVVYEKNIAVDLTFVDVERQKDFYFFGVDGLGTNERGKVDPNVKTTDEQK